MASKVFVGNLAFQTRQDEVETLFSEAGKVEEVFLPVDRDTGRPRGFAFVTFETDAEAAAAIEKFNGHELAGRALRVNAAEDRPPRSGGFNRGSFGGDGGFGGDYGGGSGHGGGKFGGGKPKGSRRNIRGKKRSL